MRIGSLAFAGQYQQIPTSDQGNMFRAEWLCPDGSGKRFWPYPTARVPEAYFAWHAATKAKTQNDFTAGCIAMQCAHGYTYLLPVFHEHMEAADITRVAALEWVRRKLGDDVPQLGEVLHACRIEDR